MKNTLRKSFLLMALALLVAGGAFAQRVGDTVQVSGQPWVIESISGDTATIRKVVAQGDGPVNCVAVADSTFGTDAISGVAWGNNTWVAVGARGKIAYSSDGRSWTAVPPGTNVGQTGFPATGTASGIGAVAFGNGMFIAVGNRMASSPDGRTWTAVTSNLSFTITSIAYGGGRWVVVGGNGQTAYSTDGRTWTAVDASAVFGRVAVNAVAYGNNRFVAVAYRNVAYSSNGTSWIAVDTSNIFVSSTNTVNGITYGGNRFVAAGMMGRIGYSADGATWTAMTNANNTPLGGSVNDVAFGNNRYVAVGDGGQVAYSPDAATWTAVTTSVFGTRDNNIRAVAYGSGRFVAVGNGGKMAYCDW